MHYISTILCCYKGHSYSLWEGTMQQYNYQEGKINGATFDPGYHIHCHLYLFG